MLKRLHRAKFGGDAVCGKESQEEIELLSCHSGGKSYQLVVQVPGVSYSEPPAP